MSETCYEDGSDDDDLYFYGNAAPPLAVPVSAGEVIPTSSNKYQMEPQESLLEEGLYKAGRPTGTRWNRRSPRRSRK